MDLINTGRTSLDKDMVQMLVAEMRRVLETRKGQRFTIGQLRNLLSENSDVQISLSAVEEAVRELDSDGVLQYNERTMNAIVRGHA